MSRDELITNNMKLVHHVIHRNFPTFGKNEDVFQEGCIGLIKAADSYDESKGEFRNYAYTSILNTIRSYFNRNKQDVEILSLDYETDMGDDCVTLLDVIPDDTSDKWFDKVERDIFISSLTDQEREVVKLMKEGKTNNEIAGMFGVTRQRVQKISSVIRSKWRWYSEKN